jgi:hypothetical protein
MACPDYHCVVCGREHATVACVACLDAARTDLRTIGDLYLLLDAESVEKGVQSQALMLAGPAANPEAWQHVAMSAIRGRLCRCIQRQQLCPSLFGKTCPDQAYLEDNRDELHPLFVLGGWEQVWRDHLDHQTDAPVTVAAAVAYLDMQIGYMAEQAEPAFEEFAKDVRGCRAHLEDVLQAGDREERGAPCLQCERPLTLIRGVGDHPDHWECRTCRRTVTEDQYRYAVGVAYIAHSDRLTATELGEKLGVKASMIRVWGSRGLVRKHGKNSDGITLYDVADAEARLELGGEAG